MCITHWRERIRRKLDKHRSTKWKLEWTSIIHHHTTNTTTITGAETRNTPTTPITLKMTTNDLEQIADGIDTEKTTKTII